jgi:hypothetical protein
MMERRGLLRWLLAIGCVGGLAALVGRRANPAAGASCTRDRVCRRCPAVEGCVQPEALSWRAVRPVERKDA